MVVVDQALVVRQLAEKIHKTDNPRHKKMLELIQQHAVAEASGSLEGLMATLGKNPAYHFFEMQGDTGPKGRDGIAEYYRNFVASKAHIFEYDCQRIVVDDEYVITEAIIRLVQPGTLLASSPMAGMADIDPAQHYLLTLRNLVIWPFDENLMIVGEDSYGGGPVEIRPLAEEELPDSYKALFAPA
jgi:hypothetical protein